MKFHKKLVGCVGILCRFFASDKRNIFHTKLCDTDYVTYIILWVIYQIHEKRKDIRKES